MTLAPRVTDAAQLLLLVVLVGACVGALAGSVQTWWYRKHGGIEPPDWTGL